MLFVVGLKAFMPGKSDFSIQVCYIAPPIEFLRALEVAPGTTLAQAIAFSGLLDAVADIDMNTCKVGIYSRLKSPDTVLKAHDRVEVYRPLQIDPMMARRSRPFSRYQSW
jgi:putative ubiquitin-RnfH superfamily antitoxin RatB of RatAB toxin-antitoxin module